MTRVWDLDLPDSDKIVLLALADCANDEGHCWPGIASLVRKCSKGERTVQASIKRLVDAGHLTRREVLGKGCNYTVHPRSAGTPAIPAPPQRMTETPAAAAGKPSVTVITEAKASLGPEVEAWNKMAKAHGLPLVRVLDNGRKQQLRLRRKEHGEAVLLEAIALVGQSPWLRGEGRDGSWRPNFDFILQPSSLRKVLEGCYGADPEKRILPPEEVRASHIKTAELFEKMGRLEDAAEYRRRAAALEKPPDPAMASNVTKLVRGIGRAA
jgi:hypothetical protein